MTTLTHADWEKRAQDLKIEGRAFINGEYTDAASGSTLSWVNIRNGIVAAVNSPPRVPVVHNTQARSTAMCAPIRSLPVRSAPAPSTHTKASLPPFPRVNARLRLRIGSSLRISLQRRRLGVVWAISRSTIHGPQRGAPGGDVGLVPMDAISAAREMTQGRLSLSIKRR